MTKASQEADIRAALQLLPGLGFSDEIVSELQATEKMVTGNKEAATAFERLRAGQPQPEATESPLIPALAAVHRFPALLQNHAAREIPFEVTARTLRDLERRMREYHEKHGTWGFDRLQWMQAHLSGALFEIGRLQYAPGGWRESFDVYGKDDGAMKAIAKENIACDAEGYPTSEAPDFRTTRKDNPTTGHQPNPATGAIAKTATELPRDAHLLIKSGDPVLHVHIPSGPGFTAEACMDSLREARCFFARHFPEKPFKAICCRTWLLDPALSKVLPADSNILSFGRLFHRLTVENASNEQHIDRIFGRRDWDNAPPHTRLQKAAKRFLEQGGRFRLSAGFLGWNEKASGS